MSDRRAQKLLLAVLWVDRRSGVADTVKLQDLYLSGVGVDLDLGRGGGREPVLGALLRLTGFRIGGNRLRLANRFAGKSRTETAKFRQEGFADRHPPLLRAADEDAAPLRDQIIRIHFKFFCDHLDSSALIFPAAARTALPMW